MFTEICPDIPVATVILALALCVGGFLSYIPQYVTLVRANSLAEAKGLSETSLFFLSCSQGALVLNSLILNWDRWACFADDGCSPWKCLTGLLAFFQITVNFLAAFPVWLILLRFKLRDSNRACLFDLGYLMTFIVIYGLAMTVSLVEHSERNTAFFGVFARVLGIGSAIVGGIVWVPQIWKLVRRRDARGLSFWMFLLQSVGGVVIVIFQAVLYEQDWTTWIGYVFVCVEQLVITLLVLWIQSRNDEYQLVNVTGE